MNKRSFWKRVNRGFLVSMVLLAGVLVYILVSLFMMMGAKKDIRSLADTVNDQVKAYLMLDEDTIRGYKDDPTALVKERERLQAEFKDKFDPDSKYLAAGVSSIMGNMIGINDSEERYTAMTPDDTEVYGCTVDENLANISVSYRYKTDGLFYDDSYVSPDNPKMELKKAKDVMLNVNINMTCKKVDGQWKIYRISGISVYTWGNKNFVEVTTA